MQKSLFSAVCLSVLISGCSSMGGSNYDEKTLVKPGKISGSVEGADSKKPLEKSKVVVYKDGKKLVTKETDKEGKYDLPVEAGTYSVKVVSKDHVTETLTVNVKPNETANVVRLRQVPKTKKVSKKGVASGKVLDAISSKPIANAQVYARKGVGVKTGKPIARTTTDNTGSYQFKDLNAGNYTLQINKADHIPNYMNMLVLNEGLLDKQNAALSPRVAKGVVRIVLNWEAKPNDLDSHLITPVIMGSSYHIYFARKGSNSSPAKAKLDIDRTSSRGGQYFPETITIYQSRPGIYKYSVENYTEKNYRHPSYPGRGKFPVSRAKVDVYTSKGLERTFHVPNSTAGDTWNVFTYNGSSGVITPVNTITP